MLKEWIWLTTRKGLGLQGIHRVLAVFGTPQRAFCATPEQLEQVPGLTPAALRGLQDRSMEEVHRILERCQRADLRVMTMADGDYPRGLLEISQPPPVLYLRGRPIPLGQEPVIALVGTRNPSAYGVRVAARLGLELSQAGALVVTGMAQGIDTAALKGALQSGKPVVSVLAGGVDVPYPLCNEGLYHDIAAAGVILSERPPGTPHKGEYFPVRNRIISGLALGVVAVECARYSGTMRTVDHALEQGRDVFAVPGNIDAPGSEGPNWLLRQGAVAVTCARDILQEYWPLYPEKLSRAAPMAPQTARQRLEPVVEQERPARAPHPLPPPQVPPMAPREGEEPSGRGQRPQFFTREQQRSRFTQEQRDVLHAMQQGGRPCLVDELVEWAQKPTRTVMASLTMLQVEGVVEELPGKRFRTLVRLE